MSERSVIATLARDKTLYALIGGYIGFCAMLIVVTGETGLSVPIRLMIFVGGTIPVGIACCRALRQIPSAILRSLITPSITFMFGMFITCWIAVIAITLIPGFSDGEQTIYASLAAINCLLAILTFEGVQWLCKPRDPRATEDRP